VRVRRKLQVSTDTDDAIFVALDPANLTAVNGLDLSQLCFSRARAPQPTKALLADGQAELLAAVLLVLPELVAIPVSYAIGSLALPLIPARNAGSATAARPDHPGRLPRIEQSEHGAQALPVTRERRAPVRAAGAVVARDGGGPGLALGISLTGAARSAASMRSVLPAHTSLLNRVVPPFLRGKQLNVALTLSAAGLTALFTQYQASGDLAGEAIVSAPIHPEGQRARSAEGSRAAPSAVRWRWDSLAVTCAPEAVTLSGVFAMNETTLPVTTTLRSWLDDRGCLHTDLKSLSVSTLNILGQDTSVPADPQLGAAITASWNDLLLSLVRAAPTPPTTADPYPRDVLMQRFVVPGTSIRIEVPGVALTIGAGKLTIFYAVPQSVQGMVGEIIGHIG
jgi:hypothetical protein